VVLPYPKCLVADISLDFVRTEAQHAVAVRSRWQRTADVLELAP
jgi:hypothetical protein